MITDKEQWPGLLVVVLTGGVAFGVAGLNRMLDPLVVGIVSGMAVNYFVGDKPVFKKGLVLAPQIFIPVGIIVYGVNLKFHQLNVIPFAAWMQIIIGIGIIFWLGIFLHKRLSISLGLALLICVGTAICGASAIALATPLLKQGSKETGSALLTITVWGLVGVFCYPFLQQFFRMDANVYATLCATTLHQTGIVKVAAGSFSPECLQTAVVIKMARTCMIIPLLIALTMFYRDASVRGEGDGKVFVPWFLWGFIGVGLVFSFVPQLHPLIPRVKPGATILWTLAMTGIGLTVRLKDVVSDLARPLLFGFVVWAALVANFFLGYFGINY